MIPLTRLSFAKANVSDQRSLLHAAINVNKKLSYLRLWRKM